MEVPLCAMCRKPVTRFVHSINTEGKLTYVAECHGQIETVEIDLRMQFVFKDVNAPLLAFVRERRAL